MRSSFKLYLLAGVLALSACQTSPDKSTQRTTDTQLDQVPTLLQQASEAPPSEQANLLLDAIDILLWHGETDWARNIIAGISPATLADNAYGRHQLLASQLAIESGSQFVAERHLTEPRLLELLPSFPPQIAIALREQRAQVFNSIAKYEDSVEERVLLDELLSKLQLDPSPLFNMSAAGMEGEEQPVVLSTPMNVEKLAVSEDKLATIETRRNHNHDALWQTLMQVSQKRLVELLQQANNQTLEGWYKLASLSKNNQSNLSKQLSLVDEWARTWPEHPASLRLPADLQLLRDLVESQPQKVALLLPLSGRLGQASAAIRDGFMASYYSASEAGEPLPDIRVYDTNAMDVNQAYDQAMLDGAEVVVGPLEKESISELALRPELPVPTLALNYADTPYGDLDKLYQFGLAVEDEATQVAQRAWQDGNRRALIFAPSNNWGDRSADTFWEEWQELGGDVTRTYRFGDDNEYLEVIGSALHIAESKQRARELRSILGRPIEFEPRRRQDVDMIFLVAHAQQARQIKPTLAFHYAAYIPVYATSQLYSEDSKSNHDMNGIRFTSLPWFFEENAPEHQAIKRYGNSAAAHQRLYALGADAYHLYPRLRQLREVERARYYGFTGALSLNAAGKIEREQIWAQYVGGKARIMPTLQEEGKRAELSE